MDYGIMDLCKVLRKEGVKRQWGDLKGLFSVLLLLQM